MAAEDEERSVEAPPPTSDARGKSPVGDGSRKRKISYAQGSDEGTAKRSKQEPGETPARSATSDGRSGDTKQNSEQWRRPSATTEEKQRGKRLFGSLLSTLSQKTSNSQQRKRQEIERRQRDKMKQQTAEEDKKRAEKRAEKRAVLHGIRMEQQITWEEQVMRSRHAKMLKLAQFLRTNSSPMMYFLPWRLSRREKDMIESQVRDCKASISRELEDFKGRKEQHLKRYRPRGVADATPTAEPAAAPSPAPHNEAPPAESPTTNPAEEDTAKTVAPLHDMHDDSGDVLVEAEEDTVIY